MSEPWNAAALRRRRWIMERLTESAEYETPMPTIRALATDAGTVPSVIYADLVALEQLGYIQRGQRKSVRSIRVLMPFLTGSVTVMKPELAGVTGGDAGHP